MFILHGSVPCQTDENEETGRPASEPLNRTDGQFVRLCDILLYMSMLVLSYDQKMHSNPLVSFLSAVTKTFLSENPMDSLC